MSMDYTKIEEKITTYTAVIIASAPAYPHGIIDSIPEIAKIGLKHNIGVHVDSAIGGLTIPFIEQLGY